MARHHRRRLQVWAAAKLQAAAAVVDPTAPGIKTLHGEASRSDPIAQLPPVLSTGHLDVADNYYDNPVALATAAELRLPEGILPKYSALSTK